MALGAVMAAREAGRPCPEQVSILGFDGVPAGAFAWPGLTTIENRRAPSVAARSRVWSTK